MKELTKIGFLAYSLPPFIGFPISRLFRALSDMDIPSCDMEYASSSDCVRLDLDIREAVSRLETSVEDFSLADVLE